MIAPKCFQRVARWLGGPWCTVLVLAYGVVLLFLATLTQNAIGVGEGAQAYFGSLLAVWRYPEGWPLGECLSHCWIVVPGGPFLALMAGLNLVFSLPSLRLRGVGLILSHFGMLVVVCAYNLPILGLGRGFGLAVAGGFFAATGLVWHLIPRDGRTGSGVARPSLFAFAVLCAPGVPFAYEMFAEWDVGFAVILMACSAVLYAASICLSTYRSGRFALFAAALLHGALVGALALRTGRVPVTDLYGALVLAGWVAALCGMVLRVPIMASASAALAAMLAACYGAAPSGAVNPAVDSARWLVGHVVTICAGCGVSLVAVAVANMRIAVSLAGRAGDFASGLDRMASKLMRLSLVLVAAGTLMGGLWAMREWGRFWGWDPKENAALMLILASALAIHARAGGLAKNEAFSWLCAACGLVLAWLLAGTNLMGAGMHSYGFMNAGTTLASAYAVTQVAVIAADALAGHIRGKRKTRQTTSPRP